jgi:putative endonuclease
MRPPLDTSFPGGTQGEDPNRPGAAPFRLNPPIPAPPLKTSRIAARQSGSETSPQPGSFPLKQPKPPAEPPHTTVASGHLAEDVAAAYLQLRGYRILERNMRDGPREMDLVAEKDGWVIVVEVRFRAGVFRGYPEETVHAGKRQHLLRAGRSCWLKHWRGRGLLRFDLVSIYLTQEGMTLKHYQHFIMPGQGAR